MLYRGAGISAQPAHVCEDYEDTYRVVLLIRTHIVVLGVLTEDELRVWLGPAAMRV